MRRLLLAVVFILPAVRDEDRVKLYDPDPDHLWNRLYSTLLVRKSPDPLRSGFDRVDPLIWEETRHLLEGAKHQEALAILDQFLKDRGEKLIGDPLRRALLQRDLWALFEWTPYGDNRDPGKKDLRLRLGKAVGRLALDEETLSKLPDTYAAAVESGVFAKAYDAKNPLQSFLPPDLFDDKGPWVCLQRDGYEPLASTHVSDFSGRSVFLVFLNLPGGRQATLGWLNDRSAQLPPGTEAALVRRMLAVDSKGELRPTRIVESVQIRHHRSQPHSYRLNGTTIESFQDTYQFNLSRERLFEKKAGGLRAVEWEERDFKTPFRSHTDDDFGNDNPLRRPPVRQICGGCHRETASKDNRVTLQSLRYGMGDPPAPSSIKVHEGTPEDEGRILVRWKSRQFTWGLLSGIVGSDR